MRPIASNELNDYESLVASHGTIFHSPRWLSCYGSGVRILGLFDRGGSLVGGACLLERRIAGLKTIRPVPYSPNCGPFLRLRSSSPGGMIEEKREAMHALMTYVNHEFPAICMITLSRQISDALPFFWSDYKVIPQYTYIIDLSLPTEQIWKDFSSSCRNDIRKAERDGLLTRKTTDMRIVKDLVVKTFTRQGKKVNRAYLDSILFGFADASNCYAFTTYRDDTPIATAFILRDPTTAYYLLGGYDPAKRHHGAGAVALYQSMLYAKDAGLAFFDFEGSVIPAIERHFRQFGGALTPYLTVNKAWLPIEMVLKLIKRNVF